MKQPPKTLLTLAIFAVGVGILLGAAAMFTSASQHTDSFSVSLDVSNQAPNITNVVSGQSIDLSADTTKTVYFLFNASDGNGADDLNHSTATVVVSLSSQTATSSSCNNQSVSGDEVEYNCSVGLPYYYNASSSWSINASVSDDQGAYVENTTETFTITDLKAIALTEASLSFTGSPGQNDVAATEGAQLVRNTGNFDFTELNLTAYDLVNGSDAVGAGNFSVNVTDSADGQTLINNSPITVQNADMTHGQDANESTYVYLDIPAGVSPLTYNSQSDWVFEAS